MDVLANKCRKHVSGQATTQECSPPCQVGYDSEAPPYGSEARER
jgi:hypothetical protein